MGGNLSRPAQDNEADLRKFHHFVAGDIREWSTFFKKTYPANYMTLPDLEELFRILYPRGSPHAFCKNLFKTINIAHSEKIDFNELMIALSILVSGSDFERLRWLFRFYDQDRDGVVSKCELLEGLSGMHDLLKGTSSESFDATKQADEIFNQLRNSSGFLSFEDFERLSEINSKCFSKIHSSGK